MGVDDLRKRCEGMPLEELLREAILNADDFEPVALEVYQAEVKHRLGDLGALIEREREKTGDTLHRLRVESFIQRGARTDGGRTVKPAHGELVLTAKGIGFIASERDRHGIPSVGLAGWLHNALKDSLSAKMATEKQKELPLSLLAMLNATVFFRAKEEMPTALVSERFVELRGDATFVLPDAGQSETLISWGRETGAPVEARRPGGLFDSVKRWFSKS
jgi:hypothetical protein